MPNLRRAIALGHGPFARFARQAYRALIAFHLPVPGTVVKPLLWVFIFARETYYYVYRVFVCEPLFKAWCKRSGRNLTTGPFVPYVLGPGDILVGDNLNIVGKLAIVFGSRFAERPTLEIGHNSGLGHEVEIVVARRITIGNHCHIAGGTRLFDSSGHPLDPAKRLANLPPEADDVKPITIGDNVWIGARCTVLPGVTIGDNSVVATGSVVTSDVPPNTLVAGYPARQIKRLA
jgi:acetyltransferase-like isoleucine patch superfamily enzyme